MAMKVLNLILLGLVFSTNLKCQQIYLWNIQKSDGKTGFIDSIGNEVFTDYFDYLDTEFKDGLVFFKKGNKSGFLNSKGKIVFNTRIENGQFSEGLLNINNKRNFYYLDVNGKIALNLNILELPKGKEISEIYPFSSGLALVRLQNNGHKDINFGATDIIYSGNKYPGDWIYGFINKKGQWIIKPTIDEPTEFKNGQCVITRNGKLQYVDSIGATILTLPYSNVRDNSEGFGIVYSDNDSCFFINKKGKKFSNLYFLRAHAFHEGLAAVEINGKWGFIDTTGKIVIEPKYYLVNDFSEGLASVSLKIAEKGYMIDSYFIEGFIDKSGNVILPFEKHVDYHFKGFNKGLTSGRRFIYSDDKRYTGYYELFYMNRKGKKIWSDILKQ